MSREKIMSVKKGAGLKMIALAVLAAAAAGAVVMVKSKPKMQRKPMSAMIPVVTSVELKPESTAVAVQCLGTVIAEDDATLEAEVSGRIMQISPSLVEGALVKKGAVLLTIDPSDYALALARAEAALLTAESNLRVEQGQQAVAQHEMELIGTATEIDPAYRDLMLRSPQLKSAQANVKTAQANLDAAQLDLDRTKIMAPFDGVIRSVEISAGDYARTGKSLLSMASASRYFVQCSLPIRSLEAFPTLNAAYPAKLTLGDGTVREGELYQILPDLSAQGRMARLLVAVNNPLATDSGRALLLGEVASVELSGRVVEGVCRIDRSHWRDGDVVWMIDADEKLRICPAKLVQGYANEVLVRVEFESGWEMITSDVAAPVDGMQLKIQGASARQEESSPKGQGSKGAR
jgi:RND family efflux transporter MFP subunit